MECVKCAVKGLGTEAKYTYEGTSLCITHMLTEHERNETGNSEQIIQFENTKYVVYDASGKLSAEYSDMAKAINKAVYIGGTWSIK